MIDLIEAANLQSPVIARTVLPWCHMHTRLGCILMNAITKNENIENPNERIDIPFES